MKNFILVFISITALLSCQKELSFESQNITPTPIVADSLLLKSYITLDTQHVTGSDTAEKMIFTYDAQKRVKIASIYVYDTAFGTIDNIYTYQLSYQGSDSLPIAYSITDNFGLNLAGTVTYNSARQISYQKEISSGDTTEKTFVYQGNKINIYNVVKYPGATIIDTDSIVINQRINAGGSIDSFSLRLDNYRWNGAFQVCIQYNDFAIFDNFKNPFYRLRYFLNLLTDYFAYGADVSPIFTPFISIGYAYGKNVSKQNITNLTHVETEFCNTVSPLVSPNSFTASYTYNAAGYPTIARVRNTGFYKYQGKRMYTYGN